MNLFSPSGPTEKGEHFETLGKTLSIYIRPRRRRRHHHHIIFIIIVIVIVITIISIVITSINLYISIHINKMYIHLEYLSQTVLSGGDPKDSLMNILRKIGRFTFDTTPWEKKGHPLEKIDDRFGYSQTNLGVFIYN